MVLPDLMHLMVFTAALIGLGLGDAFFFVLELDVFFSGI
jgi:hypothetical protein